VIAAQSVNQESASTSRTSPSAVGPRLRASGPSSQSAAVQPSSSAGQAARSPQRENAAPQSRAAASPRDIVSRLGVDTTGPPSRRASAATNADSTAKLATSAAM
jgi:hypothetical protein